MAHVTTMSHPERRLPIRISSAYDSPFIDISDSVPLSLSLSVPVTSISSSISELVVACATSEIMLAYIRAIFGLQLA